MIFKVFLLCKTNKARFTWAKEKTLHDVLQKLTLYLRILDLNRCGAASRVTAERQCVTTRLLLPCKTAVSFLTVELSWAGSGKRKQNSLGGWGFLKIPAVQKRRTRVPHVVIAHDKKMPSTLHDVWLSVFVSLRFHYNSSGFTCFFLPDSYEIRLQLVVCNCFITSLCIFRTLKRVCWKWANLQHSVYKRSVAQGCCCCCCFLTHSSCLFVCVRVCTSTTGD